MKTDKINIIDSSLSQDASKKANSSLESVEQSKKQRITFCEHSEGHLRTLIGTRRAARNRKQRRSSIAKKSRQLNRRTGYGR